jgi:O-antigen ligase
MPDFHHATPSISEWAPSWLGRPLVWLALSSGLLATAAYAWGASSQLLVVLVALPLLAILAALAVTRPDWVMFLVVAYMPFDSSRFRPVDLPSNLSVAKLLGAALLVSFLFAVVFRGATFRLFDNPLDFWVALLAATTLFSAVVSILPEHTLAALLRMARLFVLYIAIKNLIETRAQIRRIMWIILFSGSAGALFGIVKFYQARSFRIHDIRVGGVYMDPNDFAIGMVVVLALGLHLLPLVRRPLERLVIVAGLGACGYAFLLSGSRGGMLSLLVVATVYLWRHPARGRLLAVSALLVAVSIPVWPDSVRDRLIGPLVDDRSESVYVDTANQSSKRRLSYVTYGLELVAERPFFGYGYDSFELLNPRSDFARYHNPMEDGERFRPAHNGYLENAVGMGLPGLFIFAITLGFDWYLLNRLACRTAADPGLRAMAQGFELALLGILVGNLFLSIEHSKYMWMILGIATAMARVAPDPPALQEGAR